MKTKTILFSTIVLLCLFAGSFGVKAVTSIAGVDCPNEVELGQVFEVEVKIKYPEDTDCLHGSSVYLYWGIPEPIIDFDHVVILVIWDFPDYPKLSSILIPIHSSDIGIVGDTVGFMVKVFRGTIIDGVNTNVGSIISDTCYTTIIEHEDETTTDDGNRETETNGLHMSFASVLLPVIAIAIIISIKKIRRKMK